MIPVHVVVVRNTKSVMENKVLVGSIYEHFKGNRYEVIGIAKHSETLEEMVVYKALYGEKQLWVRPIGLFLDQVTRDGKTFPRFRRVE